MLGSARSATRISNSEGADEAGRTTSVDREAAIAQQTKRSVSALITNSRQKCTEKKFKFKALSACPCPEYSRDFESRAQKSNPSH